MYCVAACQHLVVWWHCCGVHLRYTGPLLPVPLWRRRVRSRGLSTTLSNRAQQFNMGDDFCNNICDPKGMVLFDKT